MLGLEAVKSQMFENDPWVENSFRQWIYSQLLLSQTQVDLEMAVWDIEIKFSLKNSELDFK